MEARSEPTLAELVQAAIGLVVNGADELRQTLGMDEDRYETFGSVHNGRGRRHYIYAVLDEIERVVMNVTMMQDAFSEPEPVPSDEHGRRLLRNTLAAIDGDQSLSLRRLTEILVELINFSGINSDPYYDHYLLYRELDQHKKRQADFREYFNCVNLNTQSRIDLTKRSIGAGEAAVQLAACWYLSKTRPNGNAQLQTFKACFERALDLATRQERVALDLTTAVAFAHQAVRSIST
jgi:hypothetical protein